MLMHREFLLFLFFNYLAKALRILYYQIGVNSRDVGVYVDKYLHGVKNTTIL
jgi:hypothetical protein